LSLVCSLVLCWFWVLDFSIFVMPSPTVPRLAICSFFSSAEACLSASASFSFQIHLLCLQLFLCLWNLGWSVRWAGSVLDSHTENDPTFWSFRTSKRSAAIIPLADIVSRLARCVRDPNWEQHNHSRERGLQSLSGSRVLWSSFVLVFFSSRMITG
jgi:hypothetical protein